MSNIGQHVHSAMQQQPGSLYFETIPESHFPRQRTWRILPPRMRRDSWSNAIALPSSCQCYFTAPLDARVCCSLLSNAPFQQFIAGSIPTQTQRHRKQPFPRGGESQNPPNEFRVPFTMHSPLGQDTLIGAIVPALCNTIACGAPNAPAVL